MVHTVEAAADGFDAGAEAGEGVGLRLMSRNSMAPLRAALTRRLRWKSMPASQTGHLVLYQTVSLSGTDGTHSAATSRAPVARAAQLSGRGRLLSEKACFKASTLGPKMVLRFSTHQA